MDTNPTKPVVLCVIAFIIGGVVGVAADPYLPASVSSAKKGYASGFAAARTIAESSQYGAFFRTQGDIRSLSGSVVQAASDRLTLKVSSAVSPFDAPLLAERTVLVSPSTKIVKLVAKDTKAFQAELTKFADMQKSGSAPATPPSPYTLTTGSMQDLKAGQSLTVTAAENIKAAGQFTASEIRIELNTMSSR